MRRFLVAVMATAITVASVAPSLAQQIPSTSQNFIRPGGGQGGPIGGGGHGGGGHGGGWHGGGGGGWHGGGGGGNWRRGHGGAGVGIGAGIAGLAAGAIIGGAIANQNGYYADPGYGAPVYDAPPPPPAYAYEPADSDADGYCAQRYRSYDPRSGTYLGNDGYRHPCP